MKNPERIGAYIIIVIGVFLQVHILFPELRLGKHITDLWPIVIILWGIAVLIRSRNRSGPIEKYGMSEADIIQSTQFIGEIFHRPVSTRFRGGTSTLIVGSGTIDLRSIRCAEGSQGIRISLGVGSINLFLAEDATYSINANVVLGEISHRGESISGFAKRLIERSSKYDIAVSKLDVEISVVIGEVVIHGGQT